MPLSTLKKSVVNGVERVKQLVATSATTPRASAFIELEQATLVNTPKFTLETYGKRVPVRVIDVYDGDTLVVAMEVGGKISAFRVRLAHLDTPELKPAMDVPDRAKIIVRAKAAQEYLASLILGHIAWLEILGFEKYGRLLANIYTTETGGISLNEQMVTTGHGVVYEGGTKG